MARFKPPRTRRNAPVSLWELLNLGDPDATAWVADAPCPQTDPDAFYPGFGENARPAKAICQTCPVRAECLATALDNGEVHGIWGGTSPEERTTLLRNRAAEAAAAVDGVSGVAA